MQQKLAHFKKLYLREKANVGIDVTPNTIYMGKSKNFKHFSVVTAKVILYCYTTT